MTDPLDNPSSRFREPRELVGLVGPWIGMLGLAGWTSVTSPWLLLLAAAGAVGGSVRRAPPNLWRSIGSVLLLGGAVGGFTGHRTLVRLATDWDSVVAERESELSALLDIRLDRLFREGDEAADELASAMDEGSLSAEVLRRIREDHGMAAVALFDPSGALREWDGIHHGPVPAGPRTGMSRYGYSDRPLFGYLYFTVPTEEGWTAVAAALLRSTLPPALAGEATDFASRFRRDTDGDIRILAPERAQGDGIWDLQWDDRTLFSVSVVVPSQSEHRSRMLLEWTRVMALLVGIVWVVLALSERGRPGARLTGGLALAGLAIALPFERLLGWPDIFSPTGFLFPGTPEGTLGKVLGVALAGGLIVGGLPMGRRVLRPELGALLPVGLGYPLIVWLFRRGASAGLLGGGEAGWIVYQMTLALLLSLAAGLAMHIARGREARSPSAHVVGVGLAMALGLTLVTAALGSGSTARAVLPAALWAAPAALIALGMGGGGGMGRVVLRWILACSIGIGASLPFAWADRVHGQRELAEVELAELGVPVEPYLEFVLRRLGRSVDSLDQAGAQPVELLYGAWVESGMAEEGYPTWLTLWSPGGIPREELYVGVPAPRPAVADNDLASAVRAPVVEQLDLPDARYLLRTALADGSIVTAVVPQRALDLRSPPNPLLGPTGSESDPVTLVPLLAEDPPGSTDHVTWRRTPEGWQGELDVMVPDGTYHAHYRLELPGPFLRLARGTLLFAFELALFLLIWLGGRLTLVGWREARPGWVDQLLSFRGRITLGLFAFFVMSSLGFGFLAYQTLNRAAVRTAELLAAHTVADAATRYFEVQGEMDLLSRGMDAELLVYEGGELVKSSQGELLELGLYEGWLPPEVHAVLDQNEELQATARSTLGRWDYMVAYRRVPDGPVLASAAPLEAGATAVRQREVADVLGFAIVAGGLLSLGLALLVGQALTRPLQILQVASERVGAGNLEVHLPTDQTGEFGSVFLAFNRMVTRLGSARQDLLRSHRRTETIVEEAATGVVALDAEGRVSLRNPRAESMLGRTLEEGQPLEAGDGPVGALAAWVEDYLREDLSEADTELHIRDRRIRVGARRIPVADGFGGTVLSLEDVTDQLRSERILAWGEMARQVAHEVKNPLTPIKLSIQHISRAWDDKRPDYGDILSRNVQAILDEIDRLAGIASSFSRFGAPAEAGTTPLEAVQVGSVVKEVLALYRAGEGPIDYDVDIAAGLPRACARESELKEVLINIFENSRAAMAEGGKVRIRTSFTDDLVEIRLADDGAGIPEEFLARVFEPQFSTRSTGTGLGLAIVRRLVESWKGSVSLVSEPGKGTEITLRLLPGSEVEEAKRQQ